MLQQLVQLILNGLITGTILALTGVGATLVFGIQRVANFAHGEFLTIAAFVGLLANVIYGQNILLAAIAAVLAAAALAVTVYRVVLRPLRGRGLVALSLITVGLGIMMQNATYMVAGPKIRQLGLDQTTVFDLELVRISPGQSVVLAMALTVVPAVAYFLSSTPVGKSMRAVSDNHDLAAVSGIDVVRIEAYVWLLAGGLAGLGGIMLAILQGTFDPSMGSQVLFLILTTVVLGGIGSAYGALAAGVALGLAMELSTWSGFAGGIEARFKPILAFAALIALLLLRPQGLFGRSRVL